MVNGNVVRLGSRSGRGGGGVDAGGGFGLDHGWMALNSKRI